MVSGYEKKGLVVKGVAIRPITDSRRCSFVLESAQPLCYPQMHITFNDSYLPLIIKCTRISYISVTHVYPLGLKSMPPWM
ncbi:hypothetical protein Syun_010742 [Stephania yunnanensis]|uniref:Uncharacterized protein n=1 Tax=Stephania yunnanensis TaxID=152371 RepID=A0AAP0KIL6_9MAGN